MELGAIKISFSLVALVVAGAIAWLLLRQRFVPRAEWKARTARGADIPAAVSRLVVMKSLRSIAISIVVAPLVVILVYGFAQWRVEASAADPRNVQSLIDTRGLLESVLQPLTVVSLNTWAVALAVLATLWIVARKARSRRSWARAVEVRRRAHVASVEALSEEELFAEAEHLDPQAVSQLRDKAAHVYERNRAQIQEAEATRMFTLGQNEEQLMSLVDIRGLVADLETHAARLQAADEQLAEEPPAPTSQEQPGS